MRVTMALHKKRAGIEIQPCFKIQYPMKNQDKDSPIKLTAQAYTGIFFIVPIGK